jgi:hypothetical protein
LLDALGRALAILDRTPHVVVDGGGVSHVAMVVHPHGGWLSVCGRRAGPGEWMLISGTPSPPVYCPVCREGLAVLDA